MQRQQQHAPVLPRKLHKNSKDILRKVHTQFGQAPARFSVDTFVQTKSLLDLWSMQAIAMRIWNDIHAYGDELVKLEVKFHLPGQEAHPYYVLILDKTE